jgi:hypothetical protein
MNSAQLLQRAAAVLRNESAGILSLIDRLDDNFVRAVELIQRCTGKVVVTGVGKSGHICAKIAATLAEHRYSIFLPTFGRSFAWRSRNGHERRRDSGGLQYRRD